MHFFHQSYYKNYKKLLIQKHNKISQPVKINTKYQSHKMQLQKLLWIKKQLYILKNLTN